MSRSLMRPSAVVLAQDLHRCAFAGLNNLVEPIARSRFSGPLPFGAGLTLVEATGRRSGLLRRRPVLGLRFGDVVLAATARPSSDWIANLRATPELGIWIGGSRIDATASVFRLPRGSLASMRINRADSS